jgi:hypothetical protein
VIVEYPEDIELYGISFNTTLAAPASPAGRNQLSRERMPLQIDDVELLFSALSPLNALIPQPAAALHQPARQLRAGRVHPRLGAPRESASSSSPRPRPSDPATGSLPSRSPWSAKSVPPRSGTCPRMKCCVTRATAPIPAAGRTFLTGALRNPVTQIDGFPTQFSWGYRLAARADYNNVFGSPFNLSPRIAFNHDVNGITPGPGGNFLEGRKSVTVGVEAHLPQPVVGGPELHANSAELARST